MGPSFEEIWIPFTKGCIVAGLVEADLVVLEKKIFKFRQRIFAFSLLYPFGKGQGPSFEQTSILFTQGGFVPSLIEIGPMVLEKKMWTVYHNTNDNNEDDNDGGQRANFEQKILMLTRALGQVS